jgi:hypothetical protein
MMVTGACRRTAMPMHDWTRVESGIYHNFHHDWISEIYRQLNPILPSDYYAMAEQQAGSYGPDVLTLEARISDPDRDGGVAVLPAKPKTTHNAKSPSEFFSTKQKSVVIRHVSGDRIVALIEIVSPGNKDSNKRFRQFIGKAVEFLRSGVHLLIVDPFPPGPRDPNGIHGAIWETLADDSFVLDLARPLTAVSYHCSDGLEAFAEPFAVGETLPAMPLYLEPNRFLTLALEPTYSAVWKNVPRRWRDVIAT